MKNEQLINILKRENVRPSNLKTFVNTHSSILRMAKYPAIIKVVEKLEAQRVKNNELEYSKREVNRLGLKSVKEYLSLKEKAIAILDDFYTGHSMGCYRYLNIQDRGVIAQNHTLDSYAKSCKWRPTYGDVTVTITLKDLRAIEKIEGVWTVKGKHHTAKWLIPVGRKASYQVLWEKGFLFATTHGRTLAEAKSDFGKKLAAQKAEKQNNQRFIGYHHLRAIGACEAGINAFARRHNLNPEWGYSLGFLKSLEPGNIYLSSL